jgi:hypothetical protein
VVATWPEASGTVESVLNTGPGAVNRIAFRLIGRYVATAGEKGAAEVWDWSGRSLVARACLRSGVVSAIFAPEGS